MAPTPAPIPAPIPPKIAASGKITDPLLGPQQEPLSGVSATANRPPTNPPTKPKRAPFPRRDLRWSILTTDASEKSTRRRDSAMTRSDWSASATNRPFVMTPDCSVIVSRSPPFSEPCRSRNELTTCAFATVAAPSAMNTKQPAMVVVSKAVRFKHPSNAAVAGVSVQFLPVTAAGAGESKRSTARTDPWPPPFRAVGCSRG